jgi:adenylate kinase
MRYVMPENTQVEKIRRHIVIIGPPFSGKTSVAHLLAPAMGLKHLNFEHLARTKNFRPEFGSLASDQAAIELIEQEIDSPDFAAGAIFDGFPQGAEQADMLRRMLKTKNRIVTDVISFKFNNDTTAHTTVLPKQAAGRQTCVSCGRVYGAVWSTLPAQKDVCDDCGRGLISAISDRSYPVARKQLETSRTILESLAKYYLQQSWYRATKPDMSEYEYVSVLTRLQFKADDLPADGVAAILRILPEAYYPFSFKVTAAPLPEVIPLNEDETP